MGLNQPHKGCCEASRRGGELRREQEESCAGSKRRVEGSEESAEWRSYNSSCKSYNRCERSHHRWSLHLQPPAACGPASRGPASPAPSRRVQLPAAPSCPDNSGPAVSSPSTPAALRPQWSSCQRSLDACGPETPVVQRPSGQRSRDTSSPAAQRSAVLMPAAPGCQWSRDASGPEMPMAPSRQQPCRKMPRHPEPRAALSAAVASSGWQPCQSGIVGSRVCVIRVVLVIVAVIVASLSSGAASSGKRSCPEWPLLGSNLMEQRPHLGSGLFLGAAPITEWPHLRSSLI
ncbi:predicted GPI-anchored protein 58 [Mustela erminea]|uniref:predicted GPI-anchored protein 58 n=1 Tax=Mustela erminea TaxID=36723 RepID=UPI0013869E52|nr:predicted GPI-anchored protein 58 [Mustela erminea]